MNLKQYKYVLTLADKGSFSKAAEELGVSQPSLSQYIKRIETENKITLFDRLNGEVRLTDAGRVYLEAAKKILDIEHQMQSEFSDIAAFQSGTITVGIAPTRCQYLMPEIVKRFSEVYPGIHLVVEERFLGNLLEDAERGQFDLCVATLPVNESVFEYDLMMHEEIVLAVPRGSTLSEKLEKRATKRDDRLYPAIDVCLLENADYVAISDTQPTQALMNAFCSRHNFSVKPAVKCMSIETQFSMVKAGVGVALIPSSLSKYSMTNSVDYYSLEQETPKRDMAVIYRKGQYLSKAMQELKEIMTSV